MCLRRTEHLRVPREAAPVTYALANSTVCLVALQDLNMVFLEAQRAGPKPADATSVPQVWDWKEPAFTEVCSGFIQQANVPAAAARQLQEYPGYFEAGGAVVTTMPAAFTAAQQALGALHFEEALKGVSMDKPYTDDPADCLPAEYTKSSVLDHVRRELRCAYRTSTSHVGAGHGRMAQTYMLMAMIF